MTEARASKAAAHLPAVVTVGASNVARTVGTAYHVARLRHGGPLDLFVAAGHGRSYGQESSFFGRRLPGILHCELWETLAQRTDRPLAAVITDVGNDLVYGAAPATIAAWVDECVRRIVALGGTVTLTELPMASLRKLGAARFWLFKRILFPKATLQRHDALCSAETLNEQLRRIARRPGVTLVEAPARWYGFDPIHVRRSYAQEAWRAFWQASWGTYEANGLDRDGVWSRWQRERQLRGARPLRQLMRGVEQYCEQPSLQLADGSRVWSY